MNSLCLQWPQEQAHRQLCQSKGRIRPCCSARFGRPWWGRLQKALQHLPLHCWRDDDGSQTSQPLNQPRTFLVCYRDRFPICLESYETRISTIAKALEFSVPYKSIQKRSNFLQFSGCKLGNASPSSSLIGCLYKTANQRPATSYSFAAVS